MKSINYYKKIKIGVRPSNLAIKQAEEIITKLELLGFQRERFTIKKYYTDGDIDKKTPISEIEGGNFFTNTVDKAVLFGDIDFAVHSAKDLPDIIAKGLKIACVTKSINRHDALISKDKLKLTELPINSKIGASSTRRKEQLKKIRNDFEIVDIRGNIEERLEKFEKNKLDGLIIAACALMRLGLENRITAEIPFHILEPHPLQGSLAIVVREDNYEFIELFKKID
ncbi:MAG: hydroxymethylbilane synthase [Elusimicrobia bacterium RIFOXYD2_FULL_34_15]|nr:MAG: hydroxymethylbilane synthase [Elusimicrobia bacterium RIFOXYD2_FULL_34_15]